MDEDQWISWVNLELGASLNMLQVAIENAKDSVWNSETDTPPFWQIAYHTILYCNFYFSDFDKNLEKPEENYTAPEYVQEFAEARDLSKSFDKVVPKDIMLKFFKETRTTLQDYFDNNLSFQVSEDASFSWLPMTKGALLLYNMRHIMQHASMLNGILRKHGVATSRWQALKPV